MTNRADPKLDRSQNEDRLWDLYYDAMEYLEAGQTSYAHTLLNKSLRLNPDFVAGYVGKVAAFGATLNTAKAEEYARKGFDATCRHFPRWPRSLEWGVLENRQYLRAIAYHADSLFDGGYHDDAIKLYRLVLTLNPNDNQGVRYVLAANYAGLHPESANVLTDVGNYLQDWSAQEKLLEVTNAKHHFWSHPGKDEG